MTMALTPEHFLFIMPKGPLMEKHLIDPAAKTLETREVISTEETASKINDFNHKLARGDIPQYRGLVVG